MNSSRHTATYQKLIMLPGPTNVPIEVTQAMVAPSIGHRTSDFSSLMKEMIRKGKILFECREDPIYLSASGTAAVEASITNILRKDDKAIVTVCGEFGGRVSEQISSVGASPIELVADYGDFPSLSDLERALENNPDTKAVYIVTNETSSGAMCHWLKEAGDLTLKYGAFLVADAVSNWGADKMPLENYNIDFIATGSQKACAAPPGLAMIALSTKYKEEMLKDPQKLHFLNLPRYIKFSDKSSQTPFTPSLPIYFALNKAYDIMIEEGMEHRYVRHQVCAKAFYDAFEAMGLQLFGTPEARSNTVVSIAYPKGLDDKEFRGSLSKNYGVVVAGGFGDYAGKIFRVGSLGMINEYYVLTTISSIANNLNRLGFKANTNAAINAALTNLSKL
ncbi:MAG TPA: alanine--glyoxylate aminotransferase family protein [Nitrososphaerales archaeon]|jgi:aspartate aminotransferase-like enzyme|nr:alanine--glyoxylate aminotransferase family protein [Nitrososphaerales archaeon]NSL74135.1 alanine--glyoxylate aminotransferase family protein [Nitrososphaerota archaeon]NSL74799.1 alanine--glyoxylate aminotransferase family protein [Nitrososphaerota archaeon]NSL75696.1 alanine--glyoxylate aminotransferase family protein [Nitrososphaerota archaeon]NSL77141.1 alanine--glyoxylate aminotransferase family protein [Nitrososphaerota archaeon]